MDYKPGSNDLINIKKLRFVSSILFVLERCKLSQYVLSPVWSLQGYIEGCEKFSEETQKEISLQLQGIG